MAKHVFFLLLPLLLHPTTSCTNLLVTPGASKSGESLVAYNADSGTLYGSLYHYPKSSHESGEKRKIYDWDSGEYKGEIPEAPHTHNVVGNVNEKGLSIAETTYGGIESLQSQKGAIMDYGSLIYVTLQRADSARSAIKTMADLMSTYGYASEGESFSISDSKEVWIMEVIGKGDSYGEMGAVWVAVRLPDGAVSAHANQARITTFDQSDSEGEDFMFSKDVISFARKVGLYKESEKDEDFSFSDIYDPVTFKSARFCESRVWTFFSKVAGYDGFEEQYEDYVAGKNLTNRMPLYLEPKNKLDVGDMFEAMRNHFEGSALELRGDVGAGNYALPYRAHPLMWSEGDEGKEYFNERPIATQQTGWNFVSVIRQAMPVELQSVIWFGVDDSSTTVRVPFLGAATQLPDGFVGKGPQDGVKPRMLEFDDSKAFWAFNLVANWAYSRWDDIYPVVLNRIIKTENKYVSELEALDSAALKAYSESGGVAEAIEIFTEYGVNTGNELIKDWNAFFGQLFARFRDGYDVVEDSAEKSCGCDVREKGYEEGVYDRIVEETGDHYLLPNESSNVFTEDEKRGRKGLSPVDKTTLKGF